MHITKDLINRFFNKNCSAEEAEEVFFFLERNESVLDEILSIEEWDKVVIENELTPKQSLYIYNAIKYELFIDRKEITPKRNIVHKIIAIAACVILVALGIPIIKYSSTKKEITKNSLSNTTNLNQQIKWDHISNNSNKTIRIKLPDSSSIYLSENSTIKFKVGPMYTKREIILNGEAFFKVAKNKEKPFVVYTKNITTTALGTSFKINTGADFKSKITVKLFTGKVIVKVKESSKRIEESIYLDPGDEFLYTLSSKSISIHRTDTEKNNSKASFNVNHLKTIDNANDVIFKNESLINVLEKLQLLFNIQINCNKKEIEQMNFSGTISKTDDIKNILFILSQMNGLIVENIDSVYIIKKETK